MAWRIENSVVGGLLNAARPKTVFGVLEVQGMEAPVSFQMTGDAEESLAGRVIEFDRDPDGDALVDIEGRFAPRQLGVAGNMHIRMAKIPVGDWKKAYMERRPIEYVWQPLLYLEWYSQNGRVVIELSNPRIIVKEGPPLPDPEYPEEPKRDAEGNVASGPSIHIVRPQEGTVQEVRPGGEGEEPGGLESYLEELNDERDEAAMSFEEKMELGERLITGGDTDFLASLLPPERIPRPEDIGEDEARTRVMSMLVPLAMFGVALHLCEHCSWHDAYRYLVNDLLFEERVPKELVKAGWTMEYSYGEVCPECLKEFEV